MARDNIPEYSATASANTVVADVNIDEGCAPSGINNAIREVMAALKDVDTGATTLTSPAFTSSTSATIKTATVKHTNDTTSMTIAANGAVTFSQVPSLPDNTVETADVQDNAITLAKMAGLTRGSIIYGNANGDPTALPVGTGVLTGNGTDVSWGAASGGVPEGTIIWHAANTPPTGYLKANGAAISRSTYATLFAVIGTTYGGGDGSSTFNVPDLRGEFARGWDDGRGIDNGRAFGSAQTDAMQGHRHNTTLDGNYFKNDGILGPGSNGWSDQPSGGTTTTGNPVTDGSNGTPRTAAETRGRNIALLACIKF